VQNSIFSSARVAILQQALSASALRHKVISNNIANVNTPGFKRSDVDFESLLNEALNSKGQLQMMRTNPRHMPMSENTLPAATVQVDDSTSMRTDGNNVDIDVEMANLAKNTIYYDAISQQLSTYFSDIKTAINGGGGS
jgi:flagellar basal-body rod protein FlgB